MSPRINCLRPVMGTSCVLADTTAAPKARTAKLACQFGRELLWVCLEPPFSQFLFAAAAASAAVNPPSGTHDVPAVLWVLSTAECRLALGFHEIGKIADAAACCVPTAAVLFNLVVSSRRAFATDRTYMSTKAVQQAMRRAVYRSKASKLNTKLKLLSTLCCLFQSTDLPWVQTTSVDKWQACARVMASRKGSFKNSLQASRRLPASSLRIFANQTTYLPLPELLFPSHGGD